jgi:CHAT domain-containing protein
MRRAASLIVPILLFFAAYASANSVAFQAKLTAALSPELRDIYLAAVTAFRNGALDTAREQYETLLTKARPTGDHLGVGLGLAGLGAVHQARKEYPLALQSLTEALPSLERSGVREVEAWALAAIGEIHLQTENAQKAVEAFERALSIGEQLVAQASDNEKLAILPVRAEIYRQKAIAHKTLEQFDKSATSLLLAASDFENLNNKQMAALALWSAADIFRDKLKKPNEAIGFYELASKQFSELGDRENYVWSNLGLASAYRELGTKESYQNAVKTLEGVLQVKNPVAAAKLTGLIHFELASILERLGDLEKALSHYQAGIIHDRKIGGGEYTHPNHHVYLYSAAKIYRHIGRYEEALENLRVLLAVLREKQDDDAEAEVLSMLADIHSWIADGDTAKEYYSQALKLYKKTDSRIDQINLLSALGELWLSDSVSFNDAVGYFRDAKKLLNKFEGLDFFDGLEHRAYKSLADQGLTEIVKKRLSSFEHWPVMVAAKLYQRWGRVVGIAGHIDEAIVLLRVALAYHLTMPFSREVGFEQAKDLYFLGEAYREKGNRIIAADFFRLCEKLAETLGSPEIHWVYSGLARTYADLGDYENAIEYFKKGLSILESIQGQQGTERMRIGVTSGALYAYRPLVRLLLESYEKTNENRYLEAAFEYTQRLKARTFREMYAISRTARIGGALGDLASKDEKIRIEMQMINNRLQNAVLESTESNQLLGRLQELRDSRDRIRRDAAKRANTVSDIFASNPVTLRQVQDVLAPDDVLLEYSIGDQHIILWIITKEQARYALISTEGEPILEEFRKTLQAPLIGSADISKHVALGKQLYHALLGQADEYLKDKRRLVIAPDGPLYYLPFEALIEAGLTNASGVSLADVPYLIKRFRVFYVPAASVLVAQHSAAQKQKRAARLPLLAFGDPIYQEEDASKALETGSGRIANRSLRGRNFDRLEFSGEEVRRIAGIWGIPSISEHLNLRERASVKRLRGLDLTQYRMVHFASHAILGDKIGVASQPALVLSQSVGNSGSEAGFLQFSDILELRLNADLVVLSACDTGLGKIHDGEGVVGLTRAFFYAGAASVVVSLWKVQDQSTALLMEKFYRYLRRGYDKAEALRHAKLELMNSTVELKATRRSQTLAAPFFWAPFILAGDAGKIVQ